MLTRGEAGKPFVTGTFSIQRLVYAYQSDGVWYTGDEDALVFSGSPALYNNSQGADVVEMLESLAFSIADRLEQSRIILFVAGEARVYERNGAWIPT
jgi:hypothetical protein